MARRSGWNPPRGKTSARGYGAAHQALRKQWQPQVEAGEVRCWRCGNTIIPGTPWHLGHDDQDRHLYRGPEHKKCNLVGASQEAHRRRHRNPTQARGQSRNWGIWSGSHGG